MALRRQVGIIYGNASAAGFEMAVSDSDLKRLDYVEVESEGHRVLGQVSTVERRSRLTYEEALAIPEGIAADNEDQLSASVHIIGWRDVQGRVQTPRSPFRAGVPVQIADERLVTAVLGLENAPDEGAYLGFVKGSRIPVTLSMDTLAQKHLSVLAKTGAGKSYTVGVILEEFLKAKVPLVILDPHGEYGSLRSPNIDDAEIEAMSRYKVRPKAFQSQVKEYALDLTLNPEAQRLVLEGINLEGRDIVDMLGGKLSGGQVGVLYQAIKEVKEHLPAYTLRDIMDGVSRNKSNAKWNVLNALEVLESTKVFDIRGTPVKELVAPGQCTIINLKGVAPDVQEIVVTRIANMLWEARKRSEVPAHILVVEEAHNFCPERNVGNAVSGPVIRTVASEGRKFGLGLVIVSQRPAKIDKNVLSQCNTQVVLKVTNPNDLKAIVQSVEGISNEAADEVQRLAVGEALVAGGGLTQPVFVSVRPRQTAHGGRSVSVLHQDEEEDEGEAAPQPSAPRAAAGPPQVARDEPVLSPASPTTAPSAATAPTAAPMAPTVPRGTSRPAASPEVLTPSARSMQGIASRKPPEVGTGAGPDSGQDSDPDGPDDSDDGDEAPAGWATPVVSQTPRRLPGVPPVRPQPREAKVWLASDAAEIHRVAARIGLVGSHQVPERTVQIVADLESAMHHDPDSKLRLLREIADNACFPQDPACIRCPMRNACQYYRDAGGQRQKGATSIRRLWRR